MSERRLYEPIKHVFSPAEVRELGEALAREEQLLRDVRARRAAVSAELGAQIKTLDRRIGELTDKVNNGFELRDVECLSILESPRPGMKTIIRLDTNEEVRVETMTLAEMQGSFGFREEPGEGPAT